MLPRHADYRRLSLVIAANWVLEPGQADAQHEDPGGPEKGVPDKAKDRRVQAGDRRQAREFSVGHSLRYQQGGQNQAATRSLGSQRGL